ncbi:hypothetical protein YASMINEVIRUS_1458 [Yasminevirus sp. GU-2018]|uniref:Uncharacterized protein n=1 Tax=Yasminevirus sp. GU-2018 TaxID=2420051 RepID=A0A5K0UC69_9VIRU|nr:hypothetical protein YASMINEVIRUS_1458 [Yasminevirus sp. GU-2018]
MSQFEYANSRNGWNVPIHRRQGMNGMMFTDSFPLNLLNAGKIRVECTFTVPDKSAENKNVEAVKNDFKQLVEEDDDLPPLVDDDDNENSNDSNENDKKVADETSEESEESDESNDSNHSEESDDADEEILEEVKRASEVESIMKKVQDVKKAFNDIQSSIANKGSFLGVVTGNVGFTTPEDDAFMAQYRAEHSDYEIKRAIRDATRNYTGQSSATTADVKVEPAQDETKPSSQPTPVNIVSENPIKITDDGHIDTDTSVSGSNFNIIYEGVKLIKLTNESCNHNGMQFVEGENVDFNPFQYNHSCGADGIYFCTLSDVEKWLDYTSAPMVWMWDVTIPANAKTAIYSKKLKTDRLILTNKRRIIDYIVNKLINMISNGTSENEVFEYINNLPSHFRKAPELEEVYLCLLSRDVNLFEKIPEDCRTYNVCLFVAKNDSDAYSKLKDECVSYEILKETVKTNVNAYAEMPEEYRSKEISENAFARDVNMYVHMPDAHKNVENTVKYLDNSSSVDTDAVPDEFMNTHDVMNRVLPINGLRLEAVDFKNKDYKNCTVAVKQNPEALYNVPLSLIDADLCVEAINKDISGWKYIPSSFKTIDLKEKAIALHPRAFDMFGVTDSEITHNMIVSVLKSGAYDSINFESQDSNMVALISQNISTYLNICPEIVNVVPSSYISDANAIEVVKRNTALFEVFRGTRSFNFTVECVKAGVDFAEIEEGMVTLDLLNELVIARGSVIDELPERFLSDDLYIVCMKVHGLRLKDVPSAYATDKLLKIGIDLFPEDNVLSVDSLIDEEAVSTTPDVPKLEIDISDIDA